MSPKRRINPNLSKEVERDYLRCVKNLLFLVKKSLEPFDLNKICENKPLNKVLNVQSKCKSEQFPKNFEFVEPSNKISSQSNETHLKLTSLTCKNNTEANQDGNYQEQTAMVEYIKKLLPNTQTSCINDLANFFTIEVRNEIPNMSETSHDDLIQEVEVTTEEIFVNNSEDETSRSYDMNIHAGIEENQQTTVKGPISDPEDHQYFTNVQQLEYQNSLKQMPVRIPAKKQAHSQLSDNKKKLSSDFNLDLTNSAFLMYSSQETHNIQTVPDNSISSTKINCTLLNKDHYNIHMVTKKKYLESFKYKGTDNIDKSHEEDNISEKEDNDVFLGFNNKACQNTIVETENIQLPKSLANRDDEVTQTYTPAKSRKRKTIRKPEKHHRIKNQEKEDLELARKIHQELNNQRKRTSRSDPKDWF